MKKILRYKYRNYRFIIKKREFLLLNYKNKCKKIYEMILLATRVQYKNLLMRIKLLLPQFYDKTKSKSRALDISRSNDGKGKD